MWDFFKTNTDPDWFCHSQNVTYDHPADDKGHFTYCPVPEKGFDGLLFASVALLVASILQGKLSALFVLIAGGFCGGMSMQFNLYQLSNSVNLWLGIQPAELFLYAFLPPLLLDSAVNIDWFVFRKVQVKVMTFAFLVVLGGTALLVPLLLYVFRLHSWGWNWVQAALFSSIIASTDAVTVNALLKSGGGPEDMVVLMEGESLFNDASSMVLFTIFFELVQTVSKSASKDPGSVFTHLPSIGYNVVVLALGGSVVGYVMGYITRKLLAFLQGRGAKPEQEMGVILSCAYLAFYLGQAVLNVSGVIAVVVFGIYGSAQGYWEISNRAMEKGVVKGFMSTLSFCTNGFVFFFAGASGVNFVIRSLEVLIVNGVWLNVLLMFAIYVSMFLIRFICISLVNPFFALLGAALPWSVMVFATVGGLRGALSLIMVQVVIQDAAKDNETQEGTEKPIDLVTAQMVLWTAGFVLLTLLVNAPLIPTVLRLTGLSAVPPARQVVRSKAKRALLRFTTSAINDLKNDEDETLRGVDWKMVQQYTNLEDDLADYGEPAQQQLEEPRLLRGMLSVMSTTQKALHGLRGGSVAKIDATLNQPILRGIAAEEVNETAFESEGEEIAEDRFLLNDVEIMEALKHEQSKDDDVEKAFAGEVPLGNIGDNKKKSVVEPTTMSIPEDLPKKESELAGVSFQGLSYRVHMSHDAEHSGRVAVVLPEFKAVRADGPPHVVPQTLKWYYSTMKGDGSLNPDSSGPGSLPIGSSNKLSSLLSKVARTNSSTTFLARSSLNLNVVDVVVEGRVRLISGIKRFLHSKKSEGLLSSKGLRILEYSCDNAIENATQPFNIWSGVEQELVGHWFTRNLAGLHYFVRKAHQALDGGCINKYILQPILSWLSGQLSARLSHKMLLACETAIAYFHALMFTPFAEWIQDADEDTGLKTEVKSELEAVWKFIIYREIEAPERFSAIQSYRAAMAVLHHQLRFIDELYHGGIVDEQEQEMLVTPVEHRMLDLEIKGATWTAPRTRDLLRTLPFFVDLPDDVFYEVVSSGQIKHYTSGEMIMAPFHTYMANFGTFVVVNGLVKAFVRQENGEVREFFMGSGSFFGLMSCLTGGSMPGSAGVVAEGNALGKGPVLFHIPCSTFQDILAKSHAGDIHYQQLEINMFRVVALSLVERTKHTIEKQALLYYYAVLLEKAKLEDLRAHHPSSAVVSKGMRAKLVGHVEQHDDDDEEEEHQEGSKGWHGSGAEDDALATVKRNQKAYKTAKSKSKALVTAIREGVIDAAMVSLDMGDVLNLDNHAVLMKGTLSCTATPDNSMGAALEFDKNIKPVVVKFEGPCVMPWKFSSKITTRTVTYIPNALKFEAETECLLLMCGSELAATSNHNSSSHSLLSLTDDILTGREASKSGPLNVKPWRQYSKRPDRLFGRRNTGVTSAELMSSAQPLSSEMIAKLA